MKIIRIYYKHAHLFESQNLFIQFPKHVTVSSKNPEWVDLAFNADNPNFEESVKLFECRGLPFEIIKNNDSYEEALEKNLKKQKDYLDNVG